MGQKMAKKEMARAEVLYNDQQFDEAAACWKLALKYIRKPVERFTIAGRICSSLQDVGKYMEALSYAGLQCEIANSLDDVGLKSEAYYNIAVCNEKSCEFGKALSYSRNSQQYSPKKSVLSGYMYLCLGGTYHGLSQYLKAWNNLVKAMDEAKTSDDRLLELLTSAQMGTVFHSLGDYERAVAYCENALDILGTFMDDEPVLKYRRQILVHVAAAHRRLGKLSQAINHCEDAMKLAMQYSDRPTQARCLFMFADIHRRGKDIERALPRYESAMSIMSELGDRLGQVECLGGMAKAAGATRDSRKAIELNNKALELAANVGCKMQMLRCHSRLQSLYERSENKVGAHRHEDYVQQLVVEMDLWCGVCDNVLGKTPAKLEPLVCGHFVHARCAVHLARSTMGRTGRRRPCPSCRRNDSKNPAYHEVS